VQPDCLAERQLATRAVHSPASCRVGTLSRFQALIAAAVDLAGAQVHQVDDGPWQAEVVDRRRKRLERLDGARCAHGEVVQTMTRLADRIGSSFCRNTTRERGEV
jgi:hypothetical protein